jgi:hypothetical protein
MMQSMHQLASQAQRKFLDSLIKEREFTAEPGSFLEAYAAGKVSLPTAFYTSQAINRLKKCPRRRAVKVG